MQLIKLNQVIVKTTLSKSTIYRLIKTSNFPKPKKLSLRAVAWLESDVDEWIQKRLSTSGSISTVSISALQAYLLSSNSSNIQWGK